jgi:hypothetical protein
VKPDLSLLPTQPIPDRPAEQFCALPEAEAQCLAVRNSKAANLLVMEAEAVATQHHGFGDGTELAQNLLRLQATHKRNEDAAIALEIFLRLVEAEGGSQNLGRRLKEIDGLADDVRNFQSRGLSSPVSKNEVESQRLELLHRHADVRGTIHELNLQLASALGIELPPGVHYWPEADLLVDPKLPDEDEAVYTGLMNRADLAAMRVASQAEGREAIAAARLLLQPLGVGLMTTDSSHCLGKLIHLCSVHKEAYTREDQLDVAHRQQQRTVEKEVREALERVRMRLSQIAITHQRQETIRVRLAASEKRQTLDASSMETRSLRLEALAAEQDLLRDVVAWKVAEVALKKAQGVLAAECGWQISGCR